MIDSIGTYLQSQGYGTLGTDLFLGSQPTSPDICTTLYENAGFSPTLTFNDDNIEYRGLQIICRGTSYIEVEARINNIYKNLCTNSISGILGCIPIQSPFSIGKDDKLRWEFSVNFKIIKKM